MRSLVIGVLAFGSGCVSIDRPELPKSWPSVVKSSPTGCAFLTGTYANAPIERAPQDQYAFLLSDLFSDREFDTSSPPPNNVRLEVGSEELLSVVGDPPTDHEVPLTGGPASSATCLDTFTLKADHAERLWTEHSSGGAVGTIKLQRLIDGSLLVELDASAAQATIVLVPMIASIRMWLRYGPTDGPMPN